MKRFLLVTALLGLLLTGCSRQKQGPSVQATKAKPALMQEARASGATSPNVVVVADCEGRSFLTEIRPAAKVSIEYDHCMYHDAIEVSLRPDMKVRLGEFIAFPPDDTLEREPSGSGKWQSWSFARIIQIGDKSVWVSPEIGEWVPVPETPAKVRKEIKYLSMLSHQGPDLRPGDVVRISVAGKKLVDARFLRSTLWGEISTIALRTRAQCVIGDAVTINADKGRITGKIAAVTEDSKDGTRIVTIKPDKTAGA